MESTIVLPRDVDLTKITYGTPRTLDNGGKVVYLALNNKPWIMQTPELTAPFGVSKWSPDARSPEKYTLELSFKGRETRESIKAFYNTMKALDKKLVSDAMQNSTAWLKKKFNNLDVVEALFTPCVRSAKDKATGEFTDKYPPTFRVSLPFKDGKLACTVYNAKREEIDLDAVVTKGARVTAIVQCTGIWVAGGKFGCSWKALQLKVVPQVSIHGFAFRQDAKDKTGPKVEDASTGGDAIDDEEDSSRLLDYSSVSGTSTTS